MTVALEKLKSEIRVKHGSLLLSCSSVAAVQQLMGLTHDCREQETKKHLAQEPSPVLARMKRLLDKGAISREVFIDFIW